MAYRTTREQRRPRLLAIAAFLPEDETVELLDLLDLSASADHLSPQATETLREIRRAFDAPAAPLFSAGQLVLIKGASDPLPHVVDEVHLAADTGPDAGWAYTIRLDPPASDDPGEVFAEEELEAFAAEPVA